MMKLSISMDKVFNSTVWEKTQILKIAHYK